MNDVEILLGIGNIGERYVSTRHNIGFVITKKFAQKYFLGKEKKFRHSLVWECMFADKKIVVCHPNTYVNNSGIAARELLDFYETNEEKILAVVDDFNLNLATVRFRQSGSDGGHNGLKSLIEHLSKNFARLRFGIGPLPENELIADFVLGKFGAEEEKTLEEKLDLAIEAIECYYKFGIVMAMNRYNSNVKKEKNNPSSPQAEDT
jgi:PTH1 family peptidyl-tRNA hydrolase